MKNVLRFLIMASFLMPFLTSSGQTFGIKGGLTLADMLLKDEEEITNTKMLPLIHIGVVSEIPLAGDFLYLEPGVFFNMKGTRYSGTGWTEKLLMNYVDVPINLKGIYAIQGIKIYGTLGPFFGVGLSGKYKWNDNGETGSETIEWGNNPDNDHFKRLDFGLGLGAGVILGKVSAGIGYDIGLANIFSDTSYGAKAGTRGLKISIGYFFTKE